MFLSQEGVLTKICLNVQAMLIDFAFTAQFSKVNLKAPNLSLFVILSTVLGYLCFQNKLSDYKKFCTCNNCKIFNGYVLRITFKTKSKDIFICNWNTKTHFSNKQTIKLLCNNVLKN